MLKPIGFFFFGILSNSLHHEKNTSWRVPLYPKLLTNRLNVQGTVNEMVTCCSGGRTRDWGLTFVGYSLGGALATVAAASFVSAGCDVKTSSLLQVAHLIPSTTKFLLHSTFDGRTAPSETYTGTELFYGSSEHACEHGTPSRWTSHFTVSEMCRYPTELLSCYTFGASKVGNIQFVKEFNSSLKNSFRMFTAENSIPPIPRSKGFVHTATSVSLLPLHKETKPQVFIDEKREYLVKNWYQRICSKRGTSGRQARFISRRYNKRFLTQFKNMLLCSAKHAEGTC